MGRIALLALLLASCGPRPTPALEAAPVDPFAELIGGWSAVIDPPARGVAARAELEIHEDGSFREAWSTAGGLTVCASSGTVSRADDQLAFTYDPGGTCPRSSGARSLDDFLGEFERDEYASVYDLLGTDNWEIAVEWVQLEDGVTQLIADRQASEEALIVRRSDDCGDDLAWTTDLDLHEGTEQHLVLMYPANHGATAAIQPGEIAFDSLDDDGDQVHGDAAGVATRVESWAGDARIEVTCDSPTTRVELLQFRIGPPDEPAEWVYEPPTYDEPDEPDEPDAPDAPDPDPVDDPPPAKEDPRVRLLAMVKTVAKNAAEDQAKDGWVCTETVVKEESDWDYTPVVWADRDYVVQIFVVGGDPAGRLEISGEEASMTRVSTGDDIYALFGTCSTGSNGTSPDIYYTNDTDAPSLLMMCRSSYSTSP